MRYTNTNGEVNFLGIERPGFVITTPENPEAVIVREDQPAEAGGAKEELRSKK